MNGAANDVVNQTNGSIKHNLTPAQKEFQSYQQDIEAQTINPNTDQYSRSPVPLMNISLNDNAIVDTSNDPQLAKTGIVNKNNPKLRNLG